MRREGRVVLEGGNGSGLESGAPRVPALWIFALLAVSAAAGVMGIFWLRKNSPILQVERRYQDLGALAVKKGLEPTLLMAVCVTEKAFAGEGARSDEELAQVLAKELAVAGPPPKGPGRGRWMHRILQKLLGSYEAASFAYDLEKRHRERWRRLLAGPSGKGG